MGLVADQCMCATGFKILVCVALAFLRKRTDQCNRGDQAGTLHQAEEYDVGRGRRVGGITLRVRRCARHSMTWEKDVGVARGFGGGKKHAERVPENARSYP